MESEICIDCIVYDKTREITKNLEAKYNELVKSDNEKDKQILGLTDKLSILTEKFEEMESMSKAIWKEITEKEQATLESITKRNN